MPPPLPPIGLVSMQMKDVKEDCSAATTDQPKTGGGCSVHGAGAKLRWKPVMRSVVGAPGEKTSVYKREYWYEYDLEYRTGKKLKQLRIAFKTSSIVKKTPSSDDTVVSDSHSDVMQGYLGTTISVVQLVCLSGQ